MTLILLIVFAAVMVAWANGANDNAKGVATLVGSRTIGYPGAIRWAAVTTLAGSIVSVFWAQQLVHTFSGRGLVPDAVVARPEFALAVAGGTALTVLLATRIGFPISTTHALIGALVGAGLVASRSGIRLGVLQHSFVVPLLFSPFIAIALAGGAYRVLRYWRLRLGVTKEWVVGVGSEERAVSNAEMASTLALSQGQVENPRLRVAAAPAGVERYSGTFLGVGVQRLLDMAHFASAGLVSFARGLNDTPKIVALLLVAPVLGATSGLLVIAVAMALGGLLGARRVARTVSHKITPMNHGQGFTANVVTAGLVIVASRMGMPVSTTHVSVGSLFGIGLATGEGRRRVISEIAASWVLTLPIAGFLSAGIFWLVARGA